MATAAPRSAERDVSIGRVFSRAFGTVGANPVVTLGIAFLFGALPSMLLHYVLQTSSADSVAELGGEIGPAVIAFLSSIIGMAIAIVTQGALVTATVAHSEGRNAGFAESTAPGLAVALPLVLTAILSTLGIFAGLILLVIPGLILFVMWSVAAPALVQERLGAIEALGRSRDLTRGARWAVFGLLLVVSIIAWLSGQLIVWINMAAFGISGDLALAISEGLPVPFAFYPLNALFQTFTLALWGVTQTSLYVELRDWKEGPATEKLADIFG